MKRIIKFFRNLHRESAIDSLRNVLAVIGGATVLADFGTMRYWMLIPCAAVAFGIWYMDYLRHFNGISIDESLVLEMKTHVQN